ncbi:hypothetical protein [Spirosoma montaniterrae]|nr:hypothetical protein [Spirosoma montaniterrae]
MSTVTIHVPEEKEEILMNFLRSIPYIVVEKSNPSTRTDSVWTRLEGKYAGAGITSETLARENDREKQREHQQGLQ